MILKFQVNGISSGGEHDRAKDSWAYHEVDEVRTEAIAKKEDWEKCSCFFYSNEDTDKMANFRLRGGNLAHVYFSIGYLLNDKGDTINCL